MSWITMLGGIWASATNDQSSGGTEVSNGANLAASVEGAKRKTAPLPSILSPVRPPNGLLPKASVMNLRRFAESPVPRRAINLIKDRIASMDWQVQYRRGYSAANVPDGERRKEILRRSLEEPNEADSLRCVMEQALEDALVGGFGAIEMEKTEDPDRPFALWPVDGATIQLNAHWDGNPDSPRYAQVTGVGGSGSKIPLYDRELMYLRVNPRSHTPFGLGPLEIAFESVNSFLAANRYASRLASNSVVQYALWLNETTPDQHNRLLRWWQDEIEGTGRVPLLTCEQKPEVLKFTGGTDAELRIEWQEFLIRMIGNAFGLPPMLLGVEHDVNRNTAQELADEAFRHTIAPTARTLAEHFTRDLFTKRLGWREFEFVFNDLDTRDEMREVQIQTALLQAGVLTVDEVRAQRGLDPLHRAREVGAVQVSNHEE